MAQKVGVSRANSRAVEMEILCKWNGNFRSNQLELKKWSTGTSEGRLFVLENFHLNHAFRLHFNWLGRKFWLNGKCPRSHMT